MAFSPMNGVLPPFDLPSRVVYFHDWRYVDHDYLRWRDASGTPIPVMEPPEPFVDAYADASLLPRGIRLESVPGTPDPEPTFSAAALDEILIFCGTAVRVDGTYRVYYESPRPETIAGGKRGWPIQHDKVLKVAESDDAVHWRFPKLAGGNNIVLDPSHVGIQGATVYHDVDGPPAERFKAIFLGKVSEAELAAYRARRPEDIDPMALSPGKMGWAHSAWSISGAVSPDGYAWTLCPRPMLIQNSDTVQSLTWDAARKRYVAYVRTWFYGRRTVGRCESADFRDFSPPEQVLWPNGAEAPTDTWYMPGYTRMPGAPDYHLLLASRWTQRGDTYSVFPFSSPDGIVWSRIPGGAVGGPAQAERGGIVALPPWCACGWNASPLVDLPGDQIGMMCGGWPVPHKYPRLMPGFGGLGWVRWTRGRLAGLRADDQGSFALFPLRDPGRHLRLNFRTSPAGHIRVEVADQAGRTFAECDDLRGDELDRLVTWCGESGLTHAAGAPVTLRFRLQDATLYSVRFD